MIPLQILSPNIIEIISSPYTILQTLEAEGNMGNLSKPLLINISIKTGIMDNIQVGANDNPEEIVSFIYLFRDFRDVFP